MAKPTDQEGWLPKVGQQVKLFAGWASAAFAILTASERALNALGKGTWIPSASALVHVSAHVLFAAISGVIAVVAWAITYFHSRRFRLFFALDQHANLTFALGTFRAPPGQFVKPLQRGQSPKGQWKPEELRNGFTGPIYAHHELRDSFRFFQRHRELRFIQTRFEPDENLMDHSLIKPIEALEHTTVFCVGSVSSNYVTRYAMNADPFISQEGFFRFVKVLKTTTDPPDAGFKLVPVVANNPNSRTKGMLSDNDSRDFAIIMRRTDDTNTYFVCAGLDAHGTEATISYLLEKWDTLSRFSKNRDFYYLVEVQKGPVSHVTKVLARARKVKGSSLFKFSTDSELKSL